MPPRNNKPWQRGRKKQQAKRPLRRILILCEDEKSSVLYLKRFKVDEDVVEVECEGTGKNTDSLMLEAIKRKEGAINERWPYQEIWVVFDRDDGQDGFPLKNYNRAFDLAAPHNEITACWSNDCFELWYLLHFQFQNTAMPRAQIFKEVGKKVGRKYEKNDGSIYDKLVERLPTALKNASRLDQLNRQNRTDRDNPSTKVHELIRKLQELDPKNFNPDDEK